jgi:hypothetical protein
MALLPDPFLDMDNEIDIIFDIMTLGADLSASAGIPYRPEAFPFIISIILTKTVDESMTSSLGEIVVLGIMSFTASHSIVSYM